MKFQKKIATDSISNSEKLRKYLYKDFLIRHVDEPVTSFALTPRCSPRMITLVPGGPSAGEMPVTTGGGLILIFF